MRVFYRVLTTLMLALPMTLIGATPASAEEEEKNYYLEQMRKQSQGKEQEPEMNMPVEDDSDMMAGSDNGAAAQYDNDYSDVGDIKPSFEKPKLEPYKAEQ